MPLVRSLPEDPLVASQTPRLKRGQLVLAIASGAFYWTTSVHICSSKCGSVESKEGPR